MSNNNTEKNKTPFYFLAAVFHREDQDIEELLAPYDANVKVDPYFVMTKEEALEEYCNESVRQNKSDEECIKELLEKGPLEWCYANEDGDFYSEENPDGKWSWWEYNSGKEYKMLKVNGESVFSAPVKDIDFSPNQEEYEKAIPFYEEAHNKDADDMNLRRIAQCYYELGNYDKALIYINQAIELDSTKVQYIPFKAKK